MFPSLARRRREFIRYNPKDGDHALLG
jgi:hypothetical protein